MEIKLCKSTIGNSNKSLHDGKNHECGNEAKNGSDKCGFNHACRYYGCGAVWVGMGSKK